MINLKEKKSNYRLKQKMLKSDKRIINTFKKSIENNNKPKLSKLELDHIIRSEGIRGIRSRDTNKFKTNVIREYLYTPIKSLNERSNEQSLNIPKSLLKKSIPLIQRREKKIFSLTYILNYNIHGVQVITRRQYSPPRLEFEDGIYKFQVIEKVLLDIVAYFYKFGMYDIKDGGNIPKNLEEI
jgi:hypothetical protein